MGSDAPHIREKFFMTSQGERLFSITIGAVLVAFTTSLFVGCQSKSNQVPDEVRALAACNDQPNITVRVYNGTEEDPGRLKEDSKLIALARDKYVVEAVSKCRSDVLKYYSETRVKNLGKGE